MGSMITFYINGKLSCDCITFLSHYECITNSLLHAFVTILQKAYWCICDCFCLSFLLFVRIMWSGLYN